MKKISLYLTLGIFVLLACASVENFLPTHPPATTTSTANPTAFIPPPVVDIPGNPRELVKYLLETNAGCELPCWWGITPGVTPWVAARQILEKTSMYIDAQEDEAEFYAKVGVYLPPPYDFAPNMEHVYHVKNGVVDTIRIYNFDLTPNYDLSKILQDYGQPTEVWLRTFAAADRGVQDFLIELFYQERGMLIEYRTAKPLREIDGKLRNCLVKDMNAPVIHLWLPGALLFEDAKSFLDTANLPEPKPLFDATGMDVESFYETFQYPETDGCLETPKSLWP